MPLLTVKFHRGTYHHNGVNQGPALLLIRSDKPGVAYPFRDDKRTAETMAQVIQVCGPAAFDGLHCTRDYTLGGGKPAALRVLVKAADLPSEVH